MHEEHGEQAELSLRSPSTPPLILSVSVKMDAECVMCKCVAGKQRKLFHAGVRSLGQNKQTIKERPGRNLNQLLPYFPQRARPGARFWSSTSKRDF